MRGERGQATVEWIGIVLLVALALAALIRLAPRADGHALATTLAHSITDPRPARIAPRTAPKPRVSENGSGKRNHSLSPADRGFVAPPLVPRPGLPVTGFRAPYRGVPARLRSRMQRGARAAWRRGAASAWRRGAVSAWRRGAVSAWRRAWYACLVYERFRWAFLHPESRFPGYTMPPSEVLRIMNDCISPVDMFRDWPMLTGRAR
jgi:hypothetical protein